MEVKPIKITKQHRNSRVPTRPTYQSLLATEEEWAKTLDCTAKIR